MRQETNNEIDLLLRRMSRGANGDVSEQDNEQHLDADELSSYAQNALPAVARARYTEHLAECSRCRKLVTELSLSLGAAVAHVNTVPEPGGLRKFLASLFSPMVLRYAAPALGVIVVMVIGFVVLRQERSDSQIAEVRQPEVSSASAPQETPQATPSVSQEAPVSKSGGIAAESQPARVASGPPTPAAAKDEAANPPAAAPAPQPVAAAAPQTPAPKATPQEKEAARKQEEVIAFTTSEPKQESVQRADDEASDKAAGRAASEKRRSLELRPGVARDSVSQTRAEEDKNDAESRSVAGRRFVKRGSVWTDTAYVASRETVNLNRGSEQFRALVADEPAIRNIAEQLDGEVIVVWKGRAYRIR